MKTRIILLTLLIASFSTTSSYAGQSAGAACSKAGQSVTANGKKLTCSLVWVAAPSKAKTISPAKSSALQSKSFQLESVSFNSDLGSAGANARVKNISNKTKSASLTITIFAADGKTVANSLMGVVNAVGAGQTVTVTFISVTGDLPSGQFKYSFQVDSEF
ncbi:MAG: hypothetical protein WCJ89_03695 [Actinomycetes bacterium]